MTRVAGFKHVGPAVWTPTEGELPLDPERVFGWNCPFELEIGVGNGLFLVALAARRPDAGFVGVERARRYMLAAAARVKKHAVTNVRIVHTTAEDVLFRYLRTRSLAAVHVYFPDPWPKKRHNKRRLFNPTNVARLAELLAPGGILRVKTDHAGYGVVIGELLAAQPGWTCIPDDRAFDDLPPTAYEIKYARDGRPVFRFAYQKD